MKVGIEFPFVDDSWLGGVSAIANLIGALDRLNDRRVEPVLIASPRTPERLLAGMTGASVLRTGLVDLSHWTNRVGRISRRAIGRNLPMELWLKKQGIEVFSHCSPLGRKAKMPTIGHIADFGYRYFQHLYLADVFKRKDEGTERICDEYSLLLLSSKAVEADYRKFFPGAKAKSAVLNIVPSAIPAAQSDFPTLLNRYDLPKRFIFSPNQFWVHKNHETIVNALAIAKARGADAHVVCTGATRDDRRPEHFDELMDLVRKLEVSDRFHVLGLVSHEDVFDLMRSSVAVLSASLFEGWGISVTEAKFLGKRLIISDIPVFREQAPERAKYFDPLDAAALADHLVDALAAHSPDEERQAEASAASAHDEAIRSYGKQYEEIVLAAAASNLKV